MATACVAQADLATPHATCGLAMRGSRGLGAMLGGHRGVRQRMANMGRRGIEHRRGCCCRVYTIYMATTGHFAPRWQIVVRRFGLGHGAHARIGTRVGIRVHAVTDAGGGDRGVECGAQHRTLVLSSQCGVHMQLAIPLSSSLPVRVPALAPDLREVQRTWVPRLAVLLLHFIHLDLPWSDPGEIVALHLLLSEANPVTSMFFAPSRCFHIYHG
jgi:hypothetical protein